ncbi:hypothetical protein BsWGS_17149 [Bradybaena similaris]
MTSCCPNFNTITVSTSVVVTSLLLLSIVGQVSARARMVEPPMRSSYWRQDISREGISAPVNINDELLNCGGFDYQWKQRNGACGACGDKSGGIRENEYPGKYSQFPPQRTYITRRNLAGVGDSDRYNVINVTIYVTANQLGYFYFRLCPYRDGPSLPYIDLEECFNSGNNLVVKDINATRYHPGSNSGYHDLHLEIPANVSCQHCILQWTYVTGYREGKNGQCNPCLGCGPQEQYVNCADIQILPVGTPPVIDETGSPLFTTARPQTPTPQVRPTTIPTPPVVRTTTRRSSIAPPVSTSAPSANVTQRPGNVTPCTPTADIVMCEARDIQRLIPGMNTWCLQNCKSGHCMPDFCDCYCMYPGYKISIHPTAFDLKTTSKTPSTPTSSTAKYHCYKPNLLWSRTPGLTGWCANNCPSMWCAGMCSLQVCP